MTLEMMAVQDGGETRMVTRVTEGWIRKRMALGVSERGIAGTEVTGGGRSRSILRRGKGMVVGRVGTDT
jgi:hypothetical protein